MIWLTSFIYLYQYIYHLEHASVLQLLRFYFRAWLWLFFYSDFLLKIY
jgi:hypothetical protein